jgi:hypothetical protein
MLRSPKFTVQRKLYKHIQRRGSFQSVPLFPVSLRNWHILSKRKIRKREVEPLGKEAKALRDPNCYYAEIQELEQGHATRALREVETLELKPSSIRQRANADDS